MTGWIAVDLDGTLAHYDGWVSENHIGAPIPLMAARVMEWISEGKDVRIFTARAGNGPAQIAAIEAWCQEHLGAVLPVTGTKDYGMVVLYDDRCVQVVTNTGELICR